jgi:hypothetical protein
LSQDGACSETPVAEIIEAVNAVGDRADATLRPWVNGAPGKLFRVRAILQEASRPLPPTAPTA